jgi:hypothetical protein
VQCKSCPQQHKINSTYNFKFVVFVVVVVAAAAAAAAATVVGGGVATAAVVHVRIMYLTLILKISAIVKHSPATN